MGMRLPACPTFGVAVAGNLKYEMRN